MYYCAGFEDGIYCPCNIQLFFVVVVKRKILDIFLIFAENRDCGYMLELPR